MLRDCVTIAGFYVPGVLLLMWLEGWSAVDSIYFLSVTVTTIGYGDLSPTTNAGQLACCALILVGIVVVLSTLSKYATTFQKFVKRATKKLMAAFGSEMVNPNDLPIGTYSPADVNDLVVPWRQYLVALAPILIIFLFWSVKWLWALDMNIFEAVYFGVVTCTTVGYGDFAPRHSADKLVCSVILIVFVVVMSNTINEIQNLRLKRKIASGTSCVPDLQTLLLHKIRDHKADPRTVQIVESDYIVAALVESGRVDGDVIRAIRRFYHWTALGVDGDHTDIDLQDLHFKLLRDQQADASQRATSLRSRLIHEAHLDDSAEIIPEDFEAWYSDVWLPKAQAAQAESLEIDEACEHAARHYERASLKIASQQQMASMGHGLTLAAKVGRHWMSRSGRTLRAKTQRYEVRPADVAAAAAVAPAPDEEAPA